MWDAPGRSPRPPGGRIPAGGATGGDPFFLGHIRRGAAAFAVHECLLPWAREHLTKLEPEWCLDYACPKQMDDALRPWGWTVNNAHPFFAPDLTCPPASAEFPAAWYEQAELERFRGTAGGRTPWPSSPTFRTCWPWPPWTSRGSPSGMAGASRDGERMWQIGVNVLPPHRGQGLAAGLTALLKDELLRRGIVPFYGTAQSHIFSLNTARNAGFRPAWAEVWARPL